jgi:hypothetical protein
MLQGFGSWVAITFMALVMIPAELAVIYILFRFALPAILKSGWQQQRSPMAKRLFVAVMIVVVVAEVALVVWIG